MRVIDDRGLVWDESSYLSHHGILGMHWGIRRYQPYPGDYHGDGKYTGKKRRKTEKLAKKDAKRYADAKMYYGQGAGTRRKLLKAELERKRKDPVYREAFDRYAQDADYARSAQRAKVERRTRDTFSAGKRVTKRYIIPAAAFAATAYYATHKQQVDSFVSKSMDKAIRSARNSKQRFQAKKFLMRMGL